MLPHKWEALNDSHIVISLVAPHEPKAWDRLPVIQHAIEGEKILVVVCHESFKGIPDPLPKFTTVVRYGTLDDFKDKVRKVFATIEEAAGPGTVNYCGDADGGPVWDSDFFKELE